MSNKSDIVNVRMVITEEKILSNIDKVQKLINPKSKKQIVQLEEDMYFKDLVESIKSYLNEYPKKKNFPSSVYNAAYGLVEFATNQFEENTKKIEELIRTREENILSAANLKELLENVINKDKEWKEKVKKAEESFPEDIIETLNIIGKAKDEESQDYQDAIKLINARINNLESNLHIEIDMERIEDRSKALSYIGIEVADALKTIPTPVASTENIVTEQNEEEESVMVEEPENIVETVNVENIETADTKVVEEQNIEQQKEEYIAQTTFEKKPTLWEKIKNSKLVKAIRYVMKIKVVLDYPALPEGKSEN